MATAVRVSDRLLKEARLVSSVENRSVTGQIEYWAKIGKCAEENPDLTYNLINCLVLRSWSRTKYPSTSLADLS